MPTGKGGSSSLLTFADGKQRKETTNAANLTTENNERRTTNLIMKAKHIILAAVLAATFAIQAATAEHKLPAPLPEFKTPEQLVVWRQEMAEKAKAADALAGKQANSASSTSAFYTGKPLVEETGSYAFKYRNLDPELNRWTTLDPSGYPDGANAFVYINNHVMSSFDPNGLEEVYFTGSQTVSLPNGNSVSRITDGKFSFTPDARGEHFSELSGQWTGNESGSYRYTEPNTDRIWELVTGTIQIFQGVSTWTGVNNVTWHQDWIKYNAIFQLNYQDDSNTSTTPYSVSSRVITGNPYE